MSKFSEFASMTALDGTETLVGLKGGLNAKSLLSTLATWILGSRSGVASVTGDYTYAAGVAYVFVDATSSDATVTLPANRLGTGKSELLVVKRIDGSENSCLIAVPDGYLINSNPTFTVDAYSTIRVILSGTEWIVV